MRTHHTARLKKALLVLALIAPIANAETLHARSHNCADLQQQLQTEGSLTFKILFGKLTTHASDAACSDPTVEAARSTWRTADNRACQLGFTCDKIVFSFDD